MERSKWLGNLKVGDEVYVSSRYGDWISKVRRITKTRIIDGKGVKFRRDDGGEVGMDRWCDTRLDIPTKDRVDVLKRRIRIRNLRDMMTIFTDWHKVSDEDFVRLEKIFSTEK